MQQQRNYSRDGQDGQGGHVRVEHTTPLWRVGAVMLFSGSIALVGFWLQRIGHAEDFATVAVITAAFTVGFWARKRPDQVEKRFGPFGKIANAVRESADDIRKFVYERPLRVGVCIALCYGIAVVIAKYAVLSLMGNFYSWELAAALGLAIGALVMAPEFFEGVRSKVSIPHEAREDGEYYRHRKDDHG